MVTPIIPFETRPLEEEPLKYLNVRCPRCKAQPGFPCLHDQRTRAVTLYQICIARVILYEAFELGTVDAHGLGRNGTIFNPNPNPDDGKEKAE